MGLREHLKKNKVAYIAAGSAIGAGLAGAGAAYAYGVDPAGAFTTGVRHWGGPAQPPAPRQPAEVGLNAGPNPLAFTGAAGAPSLRAQHAGDMDVYRTPSLRAQHTPHGPAYVPPASFTHVSATPSHSPAFTHVSETPSPPAPLRMRARMELPPRAPSTRARRAPDFYRP